MRRARKVLRLLLQLGVGFGIGWVVDWYFDEIDPIEDEELMRRIYEGG